MQYNPEELEEILNIFKSESNEIIQSLNDGFLLLEKNPKDKTPIKKLFQLSHSLKGAARMLGFNSIQDIAHKLEDILSFWKKEDVVINSDIFQEIYEVCDLLLLLVSRCVEKKSDYTDEQVKTFIGKLQKLIISNHMVHVEECIPVVDNYIHKKSIDINALILELMFVIEKEDAQDDILSVVKENLSQLDEIFNITDFDEIKFKINELIDAVNNGFDIVSVRSQILEIQNLIYSLYKELNINSSFKIEKKEKEDKEPAKEKLSNEKQTEEKLVEEKFEIILKNLSKIKKEKNIVDVVITNLNEINSLLNDKNIELILSKTVNILSLLKSKDITIDNECYMLILKCVYFAKGIFSNGKDANINNLKFLLQRLGVVEDMFAISEEKVANPIVKTGQNVLIEQKDYDNLKKNLKSYDFDEIRVLRVDTGKIDNLIGQIGELLINGIKTREHVVELSKINSKIVEWSSANKKIMNYLKYLEKRGFFNNADENSLAFYRKAQSFFLDNSQVITDLNKDFNVLYNIISEDDNKLHQTVFEIESIAKGMRVLPLATIFHSFPRMIRDIAKEKNKKIDLIVSGSDTTVDKKIIEEIKMPLIHIIRNSVSHGIEEPEIRLKNNKNEVGKIKLTARQIENNVVITIEDDGYGINLEKVKLTAINKGILSQEEVEAMNEEQLMRLLFIPGFSTENSVSDISGRGIGLDVVKTKITNLNGELSIDSELNKGCRVTIKLPVSMSTIKTFILSVNKQKYAIPINSIKYVKQVSRNEIFRRNGQDCILYDEHSIPIYSLSSALGEMSTSLFENETYTVIILENADKQAAYITDNLLGEQEVFHKKLMPPIIKIKNISGFTTLSTGEVCLIINPYELIRNTLCDSDLFLFEDKQLYLENYDENQKIVIYHDKSEFMDSLKNDIESKFKSTFVFNSVNSIYDYILKNQTDMLICKINTKDDEVMRLLKYLKTDENHNNIKLVVVSDIPEYELIKDEKDFSCSFYQKTTEYKKEKFLQSIFKL